MSLTIPKQNEFELTPSGTHVATCFQVIDLGSQISEFNGEKKVHRKVRFAWELPNEAMKDGRPFGVNKVYNLSSNEKATLVVDINAWRGKPFTQEEFGSFKLDVLIGKSCLLQVVHKESKGKIYANVGSIMALPKGQQSTPLINPPVTFSLDAFDQTVFDGLTEYLRTTIASSPEFKELKGVDDGTQQGVEVEEHDPSSIPF